MLQTIKKAASIEAAFLLESFFIFVINPLSNLMFRLFITSLIFLWCFTTQGFCVDTIPPTGKITRPIEWSVITTNAIRVAAEAHDNETGVKSVRFFAEYRDVNRTGPTYKEIGIDSVAPYEIVWDCSNILDQCAFSFYFYCEIYDSAGNVSRSKTVHAVLDRNAELSTHEFKSPKTKKPKKIDGILEQEWFEIQPIEMYNDDNKYNVYSCWDSDHLYLAATVEDSKIYSRYQKLAPAHYEWDSTWFSDTIINKVWADDCISFFFDVNSSRNSLLDLQDRMLYIAPTGAFLAYKIDVYRKVLYRLKGIQCSTNIFNDIDSSGYTVEVAIPWESMGIVPEKDYAMGLEVYTVDRENADGPRVIASWGGQPYNHLNPSEWGTLVLGQKPIFFSKLKTSLIIVTLIIIVLVLTSFFIRYKKGKPEVSSETYLTRQEHIVEKAEKYIQDNYKDSSLNRENVADYLTISSSYLSKIYKKTTHKTLPHYINELRIAKAKELLLNTEKKITEIAFELGFGTLDHFIRIFKNFEGVTPNNFRKNRPVSTKNRK